MSSLLGVVVDEGLRLLRRFLEHLAHVGRQRIPVVLADDQVRRRVDVVGQRQELLHLLQLRRVDLGERILLAVHHAGLQRGEELRELHRAGVGAVGLEHLHAPLALRHAELDALEIGGDLDRPLAVGDVAVAVLPHGEDEEPLLVGLGRELRPEQLLLDPAHVRAVLDQIRHLEHAEEIDLGAHHRRGQRHVERAELELLDHLLVAAELARAEGDDLGLAGELGVGALGEFVGRDLEQRPRLADVAELDLDLRARRRYGEERSDTAQGGGRKDAKQGARQRAADCGTAKECHRRSPWFAVAVWRITSGRAAAPDDCTPRRRGFMRRAQARRRRSPRDGPLPPARPPFDAERARARVPSRRRRACRRASGR